MMKMMKKMMNNLKKMKLMHVVVALAVMVAVVAVAMTLMKKAEGFNDDNAVEGAAGNGKKPVVVYFFYVDWCPHCTKAKPEVAKFQDDLATQNNLINNTPVEVREVNCEKEPEVAKEFNVKAYPTVVAVNNDKKEELNNKVTSSNLKDWLSSLVN